MVTQGKEGSAKDIEAATEAPPDQSKAVPKEVTPLAPEDPGQTAPIPAAGRRAQARAGRADQPRGRQARGQPGDGRRQRHRRAAGEVERARVPGRAGRQAEGRRARRHGAGRVPRSRRRRRSPQGKEAGRRRRRPPACTGMQGAKGAALAKLVAARARRSRRTRPKRAEVTAKVQEHLHRHRGRREEDPRRHRPQGRDGVRAGRGRGAAKFESFVARQDVGVQEGPVRRLARRAALGQGQAPRDARQGQRVLRGRPRALPQADGRRHLAGRRHRRRRPRRREAADRQGTRRRSRRTSRRSRPTCRRSASEAAKEIGDKFEQLESDVNDKQNAVVETLASKYVEARKGLDERIEALQAENKGLVDKAIGAIKAVINTIRELASMLTNVLARAAVRRSATSSATRSASSAT